MSYPRVFDQRYHTKWRTRFERRSCGPMQGFKLCIPPNMKNSRQLHMQSNFKVQSALAFFPLMYPVTNYMSNCEQNERGRTQNRNHQILFPSPKEFRSILLELLKLILFILYIVIYRVTVYICIHILHCILWSFPSYRSSRVLCHFPSEVPSLAWPNSTLCRSDLASWKRMPCKWWSVIPGHHFEGDTNRQWMVYLLESQTWVLPRPQWKLKSWERHSFHLAWPSPSKVMKQRSQTSFPDNLYSERPGKTHPCTVQFDGRTFEILFVSFCIPDDLMDPYWSQGRWCRLDLADFVPSQAQQSTCPSFPLLRRSSWFEGMHSCSARHLEPMQSSNLLKQGMERKAKNTFSKTCQHAPPMLNFT